MHCEMITAAKFISTSITSHSYLFVYVFVVGTPNIYSLSTCQVCNTIILYFYESHMSISILTHTEEDSETEAKCSNVQHSL